jgi:hypothetical protein
MQTLSTIVLLFKLSGVLGSSKKKGTNFQSQPDVRFVTEEKARMFGMNQYRAFGMDTIFAGREY